MRDLMQSQNAIQNYLLQKSAIFPTQIIDTPAVPASVRFAIYQEGYYLRLLEVLQQDYALIHALLPEDTFHRLIKTFIDSVPSQHRSVRWYGNEFPDFLREHPITQTQPWLAEMATFEWMLTESFDAADSSLLRLDAMANVSEEEWPVMRFRLIPSFRHITLHWNVVSLWKSFKEKNVLPAPQHSQVATHWIVWRKGMETFYHSITPDAAFMLDAMSRCVDFASICEGLCAWVNPQEVSLHAATLLKNFILDDLIAEIFYN